MISTREAHDVLAGSLACLICRGAVPKSGVYDNEVRASRATVAT